MFEHHVKRGDAPQAPRRSRTSIVIGMQQHRSSIQEQDNQNEREESNESEEAEGHETADANEAQESPWRGGRRRAGSSGARGKRTIKESRTGYTGTGTIGRALTSERHSKKVELENEDDNVVYGVQVKTANGESDVKVDAGDGRVLHIEQDREGD